MKLMRFWIVALFFGALIVPGTQQCSAQWLNAARLNTPGYGALGGGYPLAGDLSGAIGWRYQKSDRHYVGSEYQGRRDELGNQVINHTNMIDLSLRYQWTRRVELAVGVPYFASTRSQTLNTTPDLTRYQTAARGIGDVMVATRRWIFDPDTHPGRNLQLGAGVQIPTGVDNAQDTFQTLSGTTITPAIRNVDQSIQPGEGGWGLLGDATAFTSPRACPHVNAAHAHASGEQRRPERCRYDDRSVEIHVDLRPVLPSGRRRVPD